MIRLCLIEVIVHVCLKQDDIQLRRNGETFELVGVVNMGEIYNDIQLLQTASPNIPSLSDIIFFFRIFIDISIRNIPIPSISIHIPTTFKFNIPLPPPILVLY